MESAHGSSSASDQAGAAACCSAISCARVLRLIPASQVAVVPAAGTGERLAAGVQKAFYQLDGRTLVERAVDGLMESGVTWLPGFLWRFGKPFRSLIGR